MTAAARQNLTLALGATTLALLAGCDDHSGTVSVTLTTAPGSHVLDDVQTLRVTTTTPAEVHDVPRTGSGFDLSLDFAATGESTSLVIDGLDAGGTVIAAGASPRFVLGPLDGAIAIYMAAPNSVGESPVSLGEGRANIGVGSLGYGALLAGGAFASGATSDALSIYNAFDHSLVQGFPLPASRAGVAVAIGANGIAYLFGGIGAEGTPTATLWRFDTTVAPAGQYSDFGDKAGFERAGETAVPIGNEHYLLTGTPVGELYGLAGTVTAKTDIESLPIAGAGLVGTDGSNAAIFASARGVVRYHDGQFATLDIPAGARDGAAVVMLPDGKVAIVCGGGDAIRIDAATAAAQAVPGVPSDVRTDCAATATPRHLVIAGGRTSAGVVSTVEIYDAVTLAPVATVPLVVPRSNAHAIALPNGQVLIAGGFDAKSLPVATLELFTPAN